MQIKEVKVKSKQVPKEARQHSDICPMRKGMWLYKTCKKILQGKK